MAAARRRGTYSVPEVIDFTAIDDDEEEDHNADEEEDVAAVGEDSTTSPVTMPSVLLSPVAAVGGETTQDASSGIPKPRKTER